MEKKKEYERQYYQKHKKKILAYRKQYYKEHKDEMLAHKRQYYKEHRNEKLAYLKQWRETHRNEILAHYKEHRDEMLAYKKLYRKTHKNAILAYIKRWREQNKDRWHEIVRKNKSKRRNLDFVPLNEWFEGSEAHHICPTFVIYIPKELHRSIKHSVLRWENMDKINQLAWEDVYQRRGEYGQQTQ